MEWEYLLSSETIKPREEQEERWKQYPRSDFEYDYRTIISSSAFRRLQDKTQVFPLDKSDFVRTRLTHSIEVSTIARQLGEMIVDNTTGFLSKDFERNIHGEKEKIPEVLSCAGLLHDIGNPPFGHFGEVIIGEWFRGKFREEEFKYRGESVCSLLNEQMKLDLENFEGNAQALRILTKVRNKDINHDINLSKSVLSTLIKYPSRSTEFTGKEDANICKHKMGYYFSEEDVFADIANKVGTQKEDGGIVRHPLAFLLEAADDIAYVTADLEDAYKKGLFNLDEFIQFYREQCVGVKKTGTAEKLIDNLTERIEQTKDSEGKMVAFLDWMDYCRGWFMYGVAYVFSRKYKLIMNGQYNYELLAESFNAIDVGAFRKAMEKFVYEDPQIVKLELAAKTIISFLLESFTEAVLYFGEEDADKKQTKIDKKLCGLIPEGIKLDYFAAKIEGDEAHNLYLRLLMVTDFVSGMTDSYAKNLYRELKGID